MDFILYEAISFVMEFSLIRSLTLIEGMALGPCTPRRTKNRIREKRSFFLKSEIKNSEIKI